MPVVGADPSKRLVPDELREPAAPLLPSFAARAQGHPPASLHHLARFLALVGQADAHAAAVGLRPLVVQVAHVNELLEIVGDVRAEIVAARLELACGQLAFADVIEKQSLHAVEIGAAKTIELVLDHVEQQTMQPFDETQRLQVLGAETVGLHWRTMARHIEGNTHNCLTLFDAGPGYFVLSGLRQQVMHKTKSQLNSYSKRTVTGCRRNASFILIGSANARKSPHGYTRAACISGRVGSTKSSAPIGTK